MIFFSLYNFSININNISKWLKITKGHIKETLLYSYKKYVLR